VTLSIVALSVAHATLGVLLLVIALRTTLAWWLKAGLVIVTCAFFVVAFDQTRDLLGWPATRAMPARFQLLWARVVEPSRAYNEPGAIYMWVEELDENNVPSGLPRAFKVRYTRPLADKVDKARGEIVTGTPQEGSAEDMEASELDANAGNQARLETQPPTGEPPREGGQPVDPEFLVNAPQHLEFAPLPAPLLPVKTGR
jgi:hypothetical protein